MKLLLDENIHVKLKYRLIERGLDEFERKNEEMDEKIKAIISDM